MADVAAVHLNAGWVGGSTCSRSESTQAKENEMTTATKWVAPPVPLGTGSGTPGGFTASGLTNTELGDAVEAALVEQHGFEYVNDTRVGAIDLEADGFAFEVKAVTREAREYKAKP